MNNNINVLNPRTGQVDFSFERPSLGFITDECKRLKESQEAWSEAPLAQRISVMLKWAEQINIHRDKIINAESTDTGRWKIASESPDAVIWSIKGWCDKAGEIIDEASVAGNSSIMPHIKLSQKLAAYPLLGVISPWNFPFLLSCIDAIPALIAGSAAIIKPSEVTPRFIESLNETIIKVPELEKILSYVMGDGITGSQIIDNVDIVCFTGSVSTGRKVAEQCAKNFIPVFLELGGKDPVIVTKDADINVATDAVLRGAVFATGQICYSIERIYVHESIHDEFVELIIKKSKDIKLNDKDIHKGHIGPMIFNKQSTIIDSQIEDALHKGAILKTGGKSEKINGGIYYRPTVITEVDHSMNIMNDETFGPIMPIMKFSSDEEAVTLANDTDYGLSGAVIAGTEPDAMKIGSKINAGGISLMDTTLTGAILRDAEKNSFNFSGLGGSRMGPASIMRFFRKKAFMTNTKNPQRMEDMREL